MHTTQSAQKHRFGAALATAVAVSLLVAAPAGATKKAPKRAKAKVTKPAAAAPAKPANAAAPSTTAGPKTSPLPAGDMSAACAMILEAINPSLAALGRPAVAFSEAGPGASDKFPRAGGCRISSAGVSDGHVDIFTYADKAGYDAGKGVDVTVQGSFLAPQPGVGDAAVVGVDTFGTAYGYGWLNNATYRVTIKYFDKSTKTADVLAILQPLMALDIRKLPIPFLPSYKG
jgi:hypothetical protein